MSLQRYVRNTAWVVAASALALCLGAMTRGPVSAASVQGRSVNPTYTFGLQNVPKFDERAGHGGWNGTRRRGLAMRRDLGAGVGREGLLWSKFQPTGPQLGPYIADFDDAVETVYGSGLALEAMVTETPVWASTAQNIDPNKPETFKNAPPKGLSAPVFADGTDTPGLNKPINDANTWAQALAMMADRYKGRVRYWQIWNEPDYPDGVLIANEHDSRRSWTGSVNEYVRLLQVSRLVLSLHDPGSRIVTGGLGHGAYLEAMLARGASKDFDLVDFHAYGWPGSDAAVDAFRRVHDEMADVLSRHSAGAKGLLCSETGYSSSEPFEQADYVAKLYPTSLALGVESTMYYADVNPSWRNMGLVDWRTLSQKTPGYWAYKHAAAALRDVKQVSALDLPGLRGYRFERTGTAPLYIVWAPKGGGVQHVTLPVGQGRWMIHDATGKLLSQQSGSIVKFTLASSPRWIDGDFKRAYVAPQPNPVLVRRGIAFAGAEADSSAEGQGGPEAAIDTDSDTQWTSGGFKQAVAWLKVTLVKPASIRRLRLKTGPTSPGAWFDVETSQDGRLFEKAATRLTVRSWQMEDIPLSRATQARCFRLVWHDPARDGAHFSVFEVEAY
jgi:hypothetical protein